MLVVGDITRYMTRPIGTAQVHGDSTFMIKMGLDPGPRRREVISSREPTEPKSPDGNSRPMKRKTRQGVSLLGRHGDLEICQVTVCDVTWTLVNVGPRPVYKGESLG